MCLCVQLGNQGPGDLQSAESQLIARVHHVSWATLGFIRAVCCTKSMTQALSTPAWISLLLRIVDGQDLSLNPSLPKQVWHFSGSVATCFLLVHLQILALRLLSAVLPQMKDNNVVECKQLLDRVSQLLGHCLLFCSNDATLAACGMKFYFHLDAGVNQQLFKTACDFYPIRDLK